MAPSDDISSIRRIVGNFLNHLTQSFHLWYGMWDTSGLVLGFVFGSFSCQDDDDEPIAGCPPCEEGDDVYLCPINHVEVYRCFTNLSEAEDGCVDNINNGDHLVGDGPATCDNQDRGTDDAWIPGSYVDYNSSTGKYEVDKEFLNVLLAHPDQLLYDGARMEWETDHFEFVGIITGDLAQELGFQNGDELITVNGNGMSDMEEAFATFDTVYSAYTSGTTNFTVVVLRRVKPVTLQYLVVE